LKKSLLVILVLIPVQSFGWSRHNRITEIAIDSMIEVRAQKVLVTDFSDVEKNAAYILQDLKALRDAKYQDLDAFDPKLTFNENIKINKNYKFQANATSPNTNFQDMIGMQVSAADVLIKYADEPDWTMDQLLFGADQYPQIYKAQYAYMGGADSNDPIPTQAFRHMFWESWSLPHLFETFKIPVSRSPAGQAPDRAGLFLALSRRAKELHLDYWSLRFLANSLHYLEDVSQPYHSTQTATKYFMFMGAFDPKSEGPFVKLATYSSVVQHVLTYYHFAFEDYMALLIEKYYADPNSTPEAKVLVTALGVQSKDDSQIVDPNQDLYARVLAMSSMAVAEASKAGRASLKFFPQIPEKFISFDGTAANKFMDANFWSAVFKTGEGDSEGKKEYYEVVKDMYIPLGAEIRTVVKSSLNYELL